MQIPINFYTYGQWSGIFTLVCLVVAIVAFIFGWGIRFRMVGVTGFMAVLTAGLFALGLGLFSRPQIPGAVRFSVVYDNGGNQAVIAVPPTVTESEVEATLRQAAVDLFAYGRLLGSDDKLTIRARTVIHPETDLSKPLYLGQVQRSRSSDPTELDSIEIFAESFAQLPQLPAQSVN